MAFLLLHNYTDFINKVRVYFMYVIKISITIYVYVIKIKLYSLQLHYFK